MKRAVLLALVCLSLAACGDDKSEDALEDMMTGKGAPPGFPGMPGGMPTGTPDPNAWQAMGKIELTDEMMGNYVQLLEKMRDARGRPTESMLTAYSLNWQHWAAISAAIGRAHLAGTKTSTMASYEKQLESAREKLAAARTDQERERYRGMISAYEKGLGSIRDLPDATELDSKNKAVIDRWMKRIKAAGRKK